MASAMDETVGPLRRGRILLAAWAALILVVVAIGGVLLVGSSGAETERRNVRTSTGSQAQVAPTEFLLVCEGAIAEDHGVETSSHVVSWVPEGTAIPAGCHRG